MLAWLGVRISWRLSPGFVITVGAVLMAACASEPPPPPKAALVPPPSQGWSSTPTSSPHALAVSVEPSAPLSEVARAMSAKAQTDLSCVSAVFVWGDVRVDAETARMTLKSGGTTLDGWLVCETQMEPLLVAQRANPRLKAAHGGSAELRYDGSRLLLRRKWTPGEAPLGMLEGDVSDVLQKGELLAVVFDAGRPESARAPSGPVVAALGRVPAHFLFGMWPLR